MYQYQLSFGEAVSRAFQNYCNFSGRSSRSEYWWWVLFTFIVGVVIAFAFCWSQTAENFASGVTSIFFFLPSFGLLFRRLHDTGRSGWWWLLSLIPVIGTIILIVWLCQDSQPGDNKYGPMPNMRD